VTRRFKTLCALGLLSGFIGLGICQYRDFCRPGARGFDHFVYRVAVGKAWRGEDPYLEHRLGWSFLYPPPSLLFLKAIELASPRRWHPAAPFIALNLIAALLCVAILADQIDWPQRYVACLLLTSAGLIETLCAAQINGIVIVLLATFFRAWKRGAHGVSAMLLAAAICLKASPLVFAIFFCTRRHGKWLLALGAWVGGLFALAAFLIPSPHLTASFLASLRWISGQEPVPVWNYSLSAGVPALLRRFIGIDLSWTTVHTVELGILAAMLLTSYVSYTLNPGAPKRIAALFVACNVCMVLAPQILWLHHAALLIPGLWMLLIESDSRVVPTICFLALLAFQCTRCLQAELNVPPTAPCAASQVLVIVASTLFVVRSWRVHAPVRNS
jgi:glycosyl transferase family 87